MRSFLGAFRGPFARLAAARAEVTGGAHAPVSVWRSGLGRLREGLDRLPSTERPRSWLMAICLLLFLPGLFSIQPMDLGETRVAVATRQMLDSGDLLRIHLGRAETYEQPIGIHWVQAGVVRGLEALHLAHRSGIPAYRLASVLGALLAVLATHHWARAMVGRRAAFLGAVMLAGCAVVVAEAHLATADAPSLAVMVASMGLLGAAYLNPSRFTGAQAASFWLAVGAGVLLRGSVAVLVPLLTGIALAVADRGAPWLRALRPGWGLPLLLAVTLPWFIAIGAATGGQALHALLGGDLPGGIIGLGEQDRPFGLHLLIFAGTAFPAAWIVLLALPAAWRNRAKPGPRFLLAWAAPAWLLCEVAARSPDAILPVLPPLMLLGARWVLDPLRPCLPRWLVTAAWLLPAGIALAIGFQALKVAELDIREAPYGVLAAAAAVLLAWRLLAHSRAGGAWARAALLGTLLAAPLYAAVLQGTFSHLLIGRIADRIAGTAQRVAPGLPAERFGILGFDEASLLFAYGPGVHLLKDDADAANFLAAAPGRVVAVADLREGEFRRAAAALGLPVREETMILSFDPRSWDFGIMIYYRATNAPSD